jgi:hypothetical protein
MWRSCSRALYQPVSIAVLLVEVAAMLRMIWLWAAAGILFCATVSHGEELPVNGVAAEPSAEQIAALIEQLERPGFAERQAASQQLEDAGTAALLPLEATAAAGSREASGRALDIFKRHFQSGADELRLAVREALERLAQSADASTAQKARNILSPPKEPSVTSQLGVRPGGMPPPINNFGGFGGRGFGGGINGNFGGGWAPNAMAIRRISMSDINGRKVLEIDERERRVKIETTPGGAIEVEVTDKQNGGNRTRTFEAKDVDELKQREPELGRLYDQYHGPGQRKSGPIGSAGPPFGFGPTAPSRSTAMPQEVLQRQIESIDNLLELYKQRTHRNTAAQRMIDSLEQSKQGYKAMLPAEEARRLVR